MQRLFLVFLACLAFSAGPAFASSVDAPTDGVFVDADVDTTTADTVVVGVTAADDAVVSASADADGATGSTVYVAVLRKDLGIVTKVGSVKAFTHFPDKDKSNALAAAQLRDHQVEHRTTALGSRKRLNPAGDK